MSPDLEELLEAFYGLENCPPIERAHCSQRFRILLDGVLTEHPSLSRDALIRALKSRYPAFRRARSKPPTMPPRA